MYKFSICFQNTSIINNYLYEKIFDSFLANTVPVYWGCPNINELIPSNTFIDYRKFKSIEDLFNYMHNMSNDEYINYISNINKFLESEQIQKFSIDNWLDSIIKIFKEKMRKIVMLNSTVGIGGVPRVMSIWGNYFVKKGYEVEFVSNDSKDPFYEIDQILHIPYWD